MTPLRIRLAQNLLYYQKLKCMNNKTLAQKAEICEFSVTKYRKARVEEPDLKTIRKIAKALEVTVSDLLKEEKNDI